MPPTEEAPQPRGDQAPTTKKPRRKPRHKKPVNELLVTAAALDIVVTVRGNPRMADFLKTPRFRNGVVNDTGTPENHFDWARVELEPAIQSADTRLNDWKQGASAEDVKPHVKVPLKASTAASPATVSAPASAQAPDLQAKAPLEASSAAPPAAVSAPTPASAQAPALQTQQPAASVTMQDVLDRFDKVEARLQDEVGTLKVKVDKLEVDNRTLKGQVGALKGRTEY